MGPTLSLSCNPFYGPSIYGWRRNNEYLYIGRTCNIFKRIGVHHVINVKEPVRSTDYIDIWICANETDDADMESILITEHTPRYNKYRSTGITKEKSMIVKRNLISQELLDLAKR